jgi:4-hydroxybenzoate polyprenyltransferase
LAGEAVGGPGGEAVGGPGGEAASDLNRDDGRTLAAYLAFPRPEAWAKALIAPACFVLAAASTGRLGDWKRFLVLWLVLEFLIYAARYEWNDIRGIDADLRHAERTARSRLPVGTTAGARRRSIRLSALTAAARILTALLIGAVAGLTPQVLVLAVAVFVVAAAYEFLRVPRPGPASRARVIAVWLVVGLGYVIRGGLGLSTAGLAVGSLAMVAGLVCVGSFGIMFVLLTWVLEATSYCRGHRRRLARPSGTGRQATPGGAAAVPGPAGPGGRRRRPRCGGRRGERR